MVHHYTDPAPTPTPRPKRLWRASELPEAYEISDRFITIGSPAPQPLETGLRGYFVRALEVPGGVSITVRRRRGHRHARQVHTETFPPHAPVWCHQDTSLHLA